MQPAQGVVVALSASAGSVPVNQSSQDLPNAPAVSENRRALYDLVVATDHSIEEHVDVVTAALLESGSITQDITLKKEERWFRDTLHNIHAITPSGDEATRILLEAMFDRLMDQLSLIKAKRKARGYLGNSNMPDNIFNTGKQFLLQCKKNTE